MRVLQLISSSGHYGAEAMAVSLSQALQKDGIGSILGVFRNSHRPNLEVAEIAKARGLQVEWVRCQGRVDRQAWLAIREVIRREQIDLLHSHGYKSHVYGYFAARGTPCRTVATCHGYYTRTSKSGFLSVADMKVRGYREVERVLLPRFDRVVAVSNEVATSLRGAGVLGKRLAVIGNGIDVAEFESARPAEDLLEIKGRSLAVGLVGRLIQGKGHEQLFQAARTILAQCPGTVFFVIGDGPLRLRLADLARELGIAKSVVFVGKRHDMPQVYSSLDVLVLPSTAEGTPMVVIEALAAKRAVVASNVGGIPEIIDHDRTGRLIEPGNSFALQEAILTLLKNADLRRSLGTTVAAYLRKPFRPEHLLAAVAGALGGVAGA